MKNPQKHRNAQVSIPKKHHTPNKQIKLFCEIFTIIFALCSSNLISNVYAGTDSFKECVDFQVEIRYNAINQDLLHQILQQNKEQKIKVIITDNVTLYLLGQPAKRTEATTMLLLLSDFENGQVPRPLLTPSNPLTMGVNAFFHDTDIFYSLQRNIEHYYEGPPYIKTTKFNVNHNGETTYDENYFKLDHTEVEGQTLHYVFMFDLQKFVQEFVQDCVPPQQ